MLIRPLISATAMNACQHAESASRNSDETAGRCPDRAKLVNAIKPRSRPTGTPAGKPGNLPDTTAAEAYCLANRSILSRLAPASVNKLPVYVGDFLRFPELE